MPDRLIPKTCGAALLVCCFCSVLLEAQESRHKHVTALVTIRELCVDSNEFVRLDNNDESLVFRNQNESRSIPIDDFIWWNGRNVEIREPLVHLRDGSVLAGQLTAIEGQRLRLTPRLWQELNLPLAVIGCIELQISADEKSRQQQLDQMKQTSPKTRVWLTNGDVISGDFSTGQGAEQADGFPIRVGNRTSVIAWSRIAAISFANGSDVKNSEPTLEFCLIDGSCLRGNDIRIDDSEVRATCGNLELRLSLNNSVPGIDSIRSTVGGIRNLTKDGDYLTNRRPLRFEHQPLLGPRRSYRLNRSMTGTQIRFGNTAFPFGMGVPSRSSTVFQINQPSDDHWLTFGVALDPSADKNGTARCQVLKLNADNQWEAISWSAQVRSSDTKPHFARLDVSNCRAIALTVDYDDGSDVLDRVNWIMPRIDKTPKQQEQ